MPPTTAQTVGSSRPPNQVDQSIALSGSETPADKACPTRPARPRQRTCHEGWLAIGLIGIRGWRRREADCWSWARGVRRRSQEEWTPARREKRWVTLSRAAGLKNPASWVPVIWLHIRQPMKITVHRQACCPQDDQCGPLEAEYSIEPDASFSSLIQEIIKAGFLQFSFTHDRLSGEVDNKWLVEIFTLRPQRQAT